MEQFAKSWPGIPEAELKKGNAITAERLLELGVISGDPNSSAYAFRLLGLRDELIGQSLRDGKPLSICIYHGGLRINTDAEASGYHSRRAENGLSSVRRQVSSLANLVDASLLSSAERAAHDRKLCVWGARLASLKKTTTNIEG